MLVYMDECIRSNEMFTAVYKDFHNCAVRGIESYVFTIRKLNY